MLWCWGYLSYILFILKFWDGIQNFIPNVLQAVFANIFVQDRVTHSYMQSFFYGSSHIVPFCAYEFEVIHC